jgi:hypothetical protein
LTTSDKSPYKTQLAAHFTHAIGGEIRADECKSSGMIDLHATKVIDSRRDKKRTGGGKPSRRGVRRLPR